MIFLSVECICIMSTTNLPRKKRPELKDLSSIPDDTVLIKNLKKQQKVSRNKRTQYKTCYKQFTDKWSATRSTNLFYFTDDSISKVRYILSFVYILYYDLSLFTIFLLLLSFPLSLKDTLTYTFTGTYGEWVIKFISLVPSDRLLHCKLVSRLYQSVPL